MNHPSAQPRSGNPLDLHAVIEPGSSSVRMAVAQTGP